MLVGRVPLTANAVFLRLLSDLRFRIGSEYRSFEGTASWNRHSEARNNLYVMLSFELDHCLCFTCSVPTIASKFRSKSPCFDFSIFG